MSENIAPETVASASPELNGNTSQARRQTRLSMALARTSSTQIAIKHHIDEDDIAILPTVSKKAKRNRIMSSPISVGSSDSEDEPERKKDEEDRPVKVEAGLEVIPERKVSSLFADPKADFEIISEDGMSIRIPAYHLLAASPFFRDLHDREAFTSPYTLDAKAETIEDLLSLMTRREFCSTFDQQYYTRFLLLAQLARRLQCFFLLDSISHRLRDAIGKPEHLSWYIFWAAVAIDDRETCRRAIPFAASLIWPNSSKANGPSAMAKGVPGHSRLDVATMPRHCLKRLPVKYAAALGRAYLLRGRSKTGGNGDWEAVANEFYRLIMKQPTSDWEE